jgi:hypothetical protein
MTKVISRQSAESCGANSLANIEPRRGLRRGDAMRELRERETYRLVAASKLVIRVGARAAAHAAAFSLSAVSEATRHFGQGLVRAIGWVLGGFAS